MTQSPAAHLSVAGTLSPPQCTRPMYNWPADRGGIDAESIWPYEGGTGAGVTIAHAEFAWRLDHEALAHQDFPDPLPVDEGSPALAEHGTAMAGILVGSNEALAFSGICPDANLLPIAVSFAAPLELVEVLVQEVLEPGDILLVSICYEIAGWRETREQVVIPYGLLPWAQAALSDATRRGIIVVETAGNSGADLSPYANTGRGDSIIVGAGVTLDQRFLGLPDRARLRQSNYGPCVDAQGPGGWVMTLGRAADPSYELVHTDPASGHLHYYRTDFRGTCSAAAIVTGALACLQGVLRAANVAPLTPEEARKLLHLSGGPQASRSVPADRPIGRRPDLSQMLPLALANRGLTIGQLQRRQ